MNKIHENMEKKRKLTKLPSVKLSNRTLNLTCC